jgi:hypothetical protein
MTENKVCKSCGSPLVIDWNTSNIEVGNIQCMMCWRKGIFNRALRKADDE